ncbi:MAG TPA: glycosyltransferase, partial [Micromonospora sp.]
MRLLFSFVGGHGHLRPLLPFARAARAAGHQVTVLGPAYLAPVVEAAGLTAVAVGKASTQPPPRRPLRERDPAREERDLREIFAGTVARARVPLVRRLCAEWKPDVLVCDEVDFGAMIGAESLGLPYASVQVIAAGSFVRPEVVGPTLAGLRADHGLDPDPDLAMTHRWLVLSPVPPGFRDPAFPPPPTLHHVHPRVVDRPGSGKQRWRWDLARPDVPLVYATLGTAFTTECGDLFARILAALGTLPANLLLTVGEHVDPAEFGPQPANVRVERFVPQEEVLPHCDLVLSHAGSGSVLGALAHGLPMVLIPMGADQPDNAGRCARLGVARVLDPVRATPEQIRDAVREVLADPDHRRAAQRLRDEMTTAPGAAHAVALLERLAVERRPMIDEPLDDRAGGARLRALDPEDWRLWRVARLAALAEAPYAFGSQLADWQGPGDREERWRSRLSL